MPTPRSFQEIILRLQAYWAAQGCAILQPYDMEMGAGTFHPATTLRALGPAPWSAAYVQPSRRPTDGRYGDSPNRWQHYYQYQVIIKPSPPDFQDIYLGSLAAIGIDMDLHDIRFVEDDWESPTLGAWGLGWEVWCDGMEVSQFTYFQQVGGHDCRPVSGELTYGLERLAMYVLGFDDGNLMPFNDPSAPIPLTYGDIFREAEAEYARWNFDVADTAMLLRHFEDAEAECARILAEPDIDPKTGRRIVMALPGLRPVHQGQPPLQPARRPRRHLGHRAPGLHRPGARAGEDLRRRLRPRRPGGMSGRRLVLGFLAFLAVFAAALVWTQFFAYYERQQGVGALRIAGRAVPVADYDGIDATSSPLKLRGCFRIDPRRSPASTPAADATPLDRALLVPLLLRPRAHPRPRLRRREGLPHRPRRAAGLRPDARGLPRRPRLLWRQLNAKYAE